jgi:hypothetical protein
MLTRIRLRSNTGSDRSGLAFHVTKESIAIQSREAAVRSGLVTARRGTEIGPEIQFHNDLHLVVYKPRGVLDEAAVNKVLVDLLRREAMATKPFNRFSDLSAVESFHLTFKYVFHVALHRRLAYAGREPVKSAFYVTHPEAAQLVRIHALMTDQSPLNVEMFEEREAAATWLGVPVESLTVPNSERTNVIGLPADVDYVEDANLFIWRPHGVLSEALVNQIVVFVGEQEETLGRSFNRFADLSALDAVDLNFNYVFHIALDRRLSYGGAKVKSAFYVSSSDAEHYAKLHALVTDHSPLQVSIFTELEAAAKWLGVPIETLLARR